MSVLFVVGTTHLVWMAVIAGFVRVEKVAPRVLRVRYIAAVLLIAWGGSTSWMWAHDRKVAFRSEGGAAPGLFFRPDGVEVLLS